MELGGKGVLFAGACEGRGEVKARKKAGRSASDSLFPGSGGAVDPIAQSIRDGADTPLATAVHGDDSAPLNTAVDQSCRSFGRSDINAYNAGIIEPIDRFAGSIPVAWGRTVDVAELCIRFGIRTVRCVPLQQRAAAGTSVETGAVTTLQDSGPKALRGGAIPMLAVRGAIGATGVPKPAAVPTRKRWHPQSGSPSRPPAQAPTAKRASWPAIRQPRRYAPSPGPARRLLRIVPEVTFLSA